MYGEGGTANAGRCSTGEGASEAWIWISEVAWGGAGLSRIVFSKVTPQDLCFFRKVAGSSESFGASHGTYKR